MFTIATEYPPMPGDGLRTRTITVDGLPFARTVELLCESMIIRDRDGLAGRLVATPPGCTFAGPGRRGEWIRVTREPCPPCACDTPTTTDITYPVH